MNDLTSLLNADTFALAGKIVVLVLILFYAVFSLVITLQARSLRNIIQIAAFNFSFILQLLFIIHLLLVISLFFFALAIL